MSGTRDARKTGDGVKDLSRWDFCLKDRVDLGILKKETWLSGGKR